MSLSLLRLVRCCWSLGPSLGYRYWRMGNWAKKDPESLLRWAAAADKAADETDDPKFRWGCRNWAIQLRKHYSANVEHTDQP